MVPKRFKSESKRRLTTNTSNSQSMDASSPPSVDSTDCGHMSGSGEYFPRVPYNIWIKVLSNIEDPRELLKVSWVCSKWRKVIFASDGGFVKFNVLKTDRFITPSSEDRDPKTKLVPVAGEWLNAGIRYCMMRDNLYKEKPRVVKDSHLKAPYFHCIPEDFGPIEATYIQNGLDIAGLNYGYPHKIFCRYFDSELCEGVCVLDIKERTFNYIETQGYPVSISFDNEHIKMTLTNPESDSIKEWYIPQRMILQEADSEENNNNTENDRIFASQKLRLEGPRGDELLLIQENNKDEIVQLINVNTNGDIWNFDRLIPSDSLLLTHPGLEIFIIIHNQTLEVYDCKTSQRISKKFHGIRYSRQMNVVFQQTSQQSYQDFQLTDTHLIYFSGCQQSLYMCPLSVICSKSDYFHDLESIKWSHVLKLETNVLGGKKSQWTICNLDRTKRYVVLSANSDLGVGMILFDILTGYVRGYYLEVDLLDPLLAIKYKTAFKSKEVIDTYGARVLNTHDGIWIIDKQGRAVYITDLRIHVLKKIYSDSNASGTGPIPLHSLGKLIEFKSQPDKEKFTKRIKRQIEQKVFQTAV